MGKSGKRKSESALPDTSSKSRKKGSSPSKHKNVVVTSVREADSSDEQPTSPKYVRKNVKSRKSEPIPKVSRHDKDEDEDEESEEDPDREQSKIEKAKRARAAKEALDYHQRFVDTLNHDKAVVKKRKQELESTASKNDQAFLKVFKFSYKSAAPFITAKDETAYNFMALMKTKCEDTIERAQGVAARFEEVVEKSVADDYSALLDNEWGKQDEYTKRLLEIGKAVGINKFECIMKALKPGEMGEMDANTVAVMETMFPASKDSLIGWGKEAKRHEKANKRLLKSFSNVQV